MNLMEVDILKAGLKRLEEAGCTDPSIVDQK
jgi:hypothetical protein